MSPDKNINPLDELFRESLGKAEFDAPQGLWESINAGVQAANTAAGAGAAAKSAGWLAKGIITKVIGGIIVTGAVVGTAIWAVPSSQTTADKDAASVQTTGQQTIAGDQHKTVHTDNSSINAPSQETQNTAGAETGLPTAENTSRAVHTANGEPQNKTAYGTSYSHSQDNKQPAADTHTPAGSLLREKQPEKANAEGYFILSDSLVCTGEDVICTSRMNLQSPWLINGTEVRGADPSLLRHTFEQPGTYFISQGNYTRQVKVTALQAQFTTEYIGRAEFKFVPAVSQATLAWDFGDGQQKNSRCVPVEHSYLRAGNGWYRVLLTVISNKGCLDTISKMVENRFEQNARKPQVPNVFTPNGDGVNDRFEVSWDGQGAYHLTIFTATAQQVFESSQVQQTWDGTYQSNGKLCPMGLYYYVIRYQLPDGTSETLKGQVTLIP